MFHENGWGYLRFGETLYHFEHEKTAPDYPLHNIRKSDDIFRKILPPELLIGILQRRYEQREQGMPFDKGCGMQCLCSSLLKATSRVRFFFLIFSLKMDLVLIFSVDSVRSKRSQKLVKLATVLDTGSKS